MGFTGKNAGVGCCASSRVSPTRGQTLVSCLGRQTPHCSEAPRGSYPHFFELVVLLFISVFLGCCLVAKPSLFATLWTVARQVPLSMGILRAKKTRAGCRFLLQGIFPSRDGTQASSLDR